MFINLAQPQETGRTSLDADATATRQRTFGRDIFPKATNQNNRTADSCGMAKIFNFIQSKLLDNCFSDIHLIEPGGREEGEEKQLAVVSHNSPTRNLKNFVSKRKK
ncbi:hypothetical protein T02_711 [Trichinella nativa]|uniref:Uncharacterized protein n=1 Tax=Trichinella nativa TaxID=6335 RepID=A0A0V1KSC1_9BILA|nr:hypothetical protein T02_711 [Trichinella nativa]